MLESSGQCVSWGVASLQILVQSAYGSIALKVRAAPQRGPCGAMWFTCGTVTEGNSGQELACHVTQA